MLFTISRDSFLKTLQAVIGVVERSQTMPVLANVLLQVTNTDISMTASDLEVQLVADQIHLKWKKMVRSLFLAVSS